MYTVFVCSFEHGIVCVHVITSEEHNIENTKKKKISVHLQPFGQSYFDCFDEQVYLSNTCTHVHMYSVHVHVHVRVL